MDQTCEAVPSGAFAGAMAVASCQISRATVDEDVLDGLLLDLRDKIQAVIETGTRYVHSFNASLCAFEHPEETLRMHLGNLSGMIEGLSCVIRHRDVLMAKRGRENVSPFWSDDLQDELMALAEEMDDLQETIALGLSAEFRREVGDALQEAQSVNKPKPD